MRLKLLMLSVIALVTVGCTCRPHRQMDTMTGESDNIGMSADGGPLQDIHFAFDSYSLDMTSRDILKSNADYIKEHSVKSVQIEGHCDERGTNEYNMVLGASRARAAMEYLKVLGVPMSVMSTVSYGEELPLDPRHNEAAWAKNRRDHFKVVE
jgi:peptidoglycan-associated lipoprotein